MVKKEKSKKNRKRKNPKNRKEKEKIQKNRKRKKRKREKNQKGKNEKNEEPCIGVEGLLDKIGVLGLGPIPDSQKCAKRGSCRHLIFSGTSWIT